MYNLHLVSHTPGHKVQGVTPEAHNEAHPDSDWNALGDAGCSQLSADGDCCRPGQRDRRLSTGLNDGPEASSLRPSQGPWRCGNA